jgi:hypothetical protein
MKIHLLLFFSFLLLMEITLDSCKTTTYTVDKLPAQQLCFGNGGGFAAQENCYTLLENGQLFLSNRLTKTTEALPSIKSKKAKTFFEKYEKLKLNELSLNEPGNTYSFIEKKDSLGVHRIVWGATFTQQDSSLNGLKAFYDGLKKVVVRTKN